MKLFNKKPKQPTQIELMDQKFVNLVSQLNDRFNQIGDDLDTLFAGRDEDSKKLNSLINEIATNGVVRDINKAKKDIAEIQANQAALAANVIARFRQLDTNGMATAVNKLNKEVFGKKKEDGSIISRVITQLAGGQPEESVTLAGKVDALIEHAGLDISVKPREVIESKIVTKKAKKGRK